MSLFDPPTPDHLFAAKGNRVRLERDSNVDGKVDFIENSTFDVNDYRIRYELDQTADGKLAYVKVATYVATGWAAALTWL